MNLVAELRERLEISEEENRQLRDLLADPKVRIPAEWRLTLAEARLFRCLASHEVMSKDMAMNALYFDRVEPALGIRILDAFIYRLRGKVRPFDVEIPLVWGIGWRLESREIYSAGRGDAGEVPADV